MKIVPSIFAAIFGTAAVALAAGETSATDLIETAAPGLAFYAFAPTPPMGWNSYDAFGDTVTEAEVMSNANYVKEKLLPHGWNYVVIDFRWYDPPTAGQRSCS